MDSALADWARAVFKTFIHSGVTEKEMADQIRNLSEAINTIFDQNWTKRFFYHIDIFLIGKYNESMEKTLKAALADAMRAFELPRYGQLPNVGLYLEQTTKYINQCLLPLGFSETTGSMVRNYVKMGLVRNPIHKQYDAEHIAHLMAITVLKHVLPLEYIHKMFDRQVEVYTDQVAYDYFCMEMENMLHFLFGVKDSLDEVGTTDTLEKEILHSAIVAVSHMVYVNACFRYLSSEE